jgi:hypothetical protein
MRIALATPGTVLMARAEVYSPGFVRGVRGISRDRVDATGSMRRFETHP